MIVELPPSLIADIAAWRDDRDRVSALEADADPLPAPDDWYASDDWAVEIVNQIETIISKGGET